MTMHPILEAVLKSVVILVVALTGFAYMTWIERRFIARLQARLGPNRAGPAGLLQPVADGIKLIVKESITPANADKFIYFLAPMVAVVPAMLLFAVVPVGSGGLFQMAATSQVGTLFVMAVLGVGVYGMVLAGWASNNKYAMLGGMRASAQVISYELGLGLSILSVMLMASSGSLADIVAYQQPGDILGWLIFRQPVAAAMFAITAMAELARAPFDLVEAEQELTAGYMTEYSGMKFALFFMSEYVKMVAMSALFVTFFLGGWSGPFVNEAPVLSLFYFAIKVLACLLLMVWTRATLPRFRYDKLMAFGWKLLLPLGLANVVLTGFLIVAGVPGYK
jgi:NADH-quinone oxidoreductase subunit H